MLCPRTFNFECEPSWRLMTLKSFIHFHSSWSCVTEHTSLDGVDQLASFSSRVWPEVFTARTDTGVSSRPCSRCPACGAAVTQVVIEGVVVVVRWCCDVLIIIIIITRASCGPGATRLWWSRTRSNTSCESDR